ncbi:MAG: MFS transporter [Pseudomonadota bacterium]
MLLRTRRAISSQLFPLFAAQAPADFADWLDYVAIGALLAFTWQVDPFVFACLAVCLGLPYLLVGPFAGVLIDRSDLKTVLVLSNLGRAIATACLALASNWEILLLVVFLRSCSDAFFTPAKQAAIQSLTDEGNRMAVNGISHAINQSSKIVAPALGGALLLVFPAHQIFLLNALVSLFAMFAAMLIRLPQSCQSKGGSGVSLRSDLLIGWQEVRCKPTLKAAVFLMAAAFFSMFFYDTLIAPLVKELSFSKTMFGYTLAAVGAGGVLGSLVFGTRKQRSSSFVLVARSAVLSGILAICLGVFEISRVNVAAEIILSIAFLIGFATASMLVPFRTVIQTETDPSRIARVSSLSEAMNTFALLTAPFIGAALANATGIGAVFVVGGTLMIGVGVMAVCCFLKLKR